MLINRFFNASQVFEFIAIFVASVLLSLPTLALFAYLIEFTLLQ